MEESLAQLHAKFDSFGSQLAKIDVLEKTILNLAAENAAFREEIREKDKTINLLTDRVNKLDQSLRANSIRIHGLPISSDTPATEVPNIVFKEIILPVIEKAKQNGDVPSAFTPNIHFTLVNAFALPSKKTTTAPVVVKFYSEFIRSLVFKHKRAALPTAPDPSSHRIRPIYAIYEDLTPTNHTHLRTFADDSRVKSAWTFNGQVRFKTHNDDTVYRATSLSDTYDTIVKAKPSRSGATPLLSGT
jgi:hypothetical protein